MLILFGCVMDPLKLVALDAEDLAVVSAHLQDAIVRVGDLAYLPGQRRFASVVRRFDWEEPHTARRRLTGLHFERVLGVRTKGVDRSRPDDMLNLLAVRFETADPPSGMAELVFAGGGCVQLDLECLEVQIKDLGPIWSAASRPAHDREDD